MKAGDRIRVSCPYVGLIDYTIEEFRFSLGFFESEQHREMSLFTPLCDLYERGPNSNNDYMSNLGPFITNPVQAWMDLPKTGISK